MHKEVFDYKQTALLSFVKRFKKNFFLVGGTAIALQIGHRKSLDFDLFTSKKIEKKKIDQEIRDGKFQLQATLINNPDEYTIVLNGVKFTFLEYPFPIQGKRPLDNIIFMPELIDLAAMKAYAMGRRATWKDYVDLYFLLKNHFPLTKISRRAKKIFHGGFNEKLFRQQLCYFEDVDFTEKIDFLKEKIPVGEIQKFLSEKAVE